MRPRSSSWVIRARAVWISLYASRALAESAASGSANISSQAGAPPRFVAIEP